MKFTRPGNPGDTCQSCGRRRLARVHRGNISAGGPIMDTVGCAHCDDPDPRFTISTLFPPA